MHTEVPNHTGAIGNNSVSTPCTFHWSSGRIIYFLFSNNVHTSKKNKWKNIQITYSLVNVLMHCCTSLIASRLYIYVYNFNAKMHANILILYFASFGCMNEWINEWRSEWIGCVLCFGGAAKGLAVALCFMRRTRQSRDGLKTNPATQRAAHSLHTKSPALLMLIMRRMEVHCCDVRVRVKVYSGDAMDWELHKTFKREIEGVTFWISKCDSLNGGRCSPFHFRVHLSSTYHAIPFELNMLF